MRYNGLQLVIRLAVQGAKNPVLERYRDALILGAIREDVLCLSLPGGKPKIWEHWSFSHFSGDWVGGGFIPLIYPGAARKAQFFYYRAIRLWNAGEKARALMNLGRASHLMIDMACPVHARRVPHLSDGYEWYIEGNYEKLKALPVPVSPSEESVYELVQGMARFTQQFEPDRTNHHFGLLLKKLGLRKSLTRRDFALQAEMIIPEAASRLGSVYLKFIEATGSEAAAC